MKVIKSMRNFDKGNIVVRFKPDYFDNPFHYEQFLQVSVVSDANDSVFSTNGRPVSSLDNGTNYTDAYQNDGTLVHHIVGSTEKWYNWETEQDTINNIIAKAKEDYLKNIRIKNDEKINELNKQIKDIEKEIKRLDNMEITPFGFGELDVPAHIEKVEKAIARKIKNAKN